MLPLRWLSPEVITQGLFTSKSDVWAFGVLLWEIITLGEQHYSNRQNTEVCLKYAWHYRFKSFKVLNLLSNGICLERPLECPEELYQVMRSCWTIPAEQRPKFLDIQPRMESIRGLTHFQVIKVENIYLIFFSNFKVQRPFPVWNFEWFRKFIRFQHIHSWI